MIPRQGRDIDPARYLTVELTGDEWSQHIIGGMAKDVRIFPRRKLISRPDSPFTDKGQVLLHVRVTNKPKKNEIGCNLFKDGNIRFALERFEKAFISAATDGFVPGKSPDRSGIDHNPRHIMICQ